MPARGQHTSQPPAFGRLLLRIAGRIVPFRERPEWLVKWQGDFREWWTLVERGEVILFGPAQVVQYCREAFREAFWRRFSRDGVRDLMRGPGLVLATLGGMAVLVGLLSRGFWGTRSLLALAAHPSAGSDSLVGHGFSIGFGLAIALGAASLQRLPLLLNGWRYCLFFLAKTVMLVALVALVWIEAGAAFWASTPLPGNPEITLYFALWASTMAAFGCVALWSCRDQRLRCPTCLKRLGLPVSMGSWGSVLEPATTEMVCEAGHGALSVTDTDAAEPDRWTVFGPSWKDLFQT